jgi:signal transduction histidine kinase
VDVLITESNENLIVDVISHGIPFRKKSSQSCLKLSKWKNAQNISGSGLGLRIVKRILEYHDAQIIYTSPGELLNKFSVIFRK